MNTLGAVRQKLTPQLTGQIHTRPLHRSSRPPTPTALGANTQCGSVLATEIDAYRRRIQTLLHFFDCIAQHWWDQLYPYKLDFIKRPSKSADEIRSYQSRLAARINKFTMRTVVPGAAAVALMEAQARVKVFPASLLIPLAKDVNVSELPSTSESGTVLLHKACSLARRLGDIEKLKQRLILAALTWITSDGRDFSLRAQRLTMLVRHANPCLIEHFRGITALLTHYYRPRILMNEKENDGSEDTRSVATVRAEPITASRLTTTNGQIMEVIETVLPRQKRYLSIESDFIPDLHLLDEVKTVRKGDGNKLHSGRLKEKREKVPMHFQGDRKQDPENTGSKPFAMLPSIVLNPLSLDTSELDWLSYEINRREFNLHLLETEEPDDDETINTISRTPNHRKYPERTGETITSSLFPLTRQDPKTMPEMYGLTTSENGPSYVYNEEATSEQPPLRTTPIRSSDTNESVSLVSSDSGSSSTLLLLDDERYSDKFKPLAHLPHPLHGVSNSPVSLVNMSPYGEPRMSSGYSTCSWQSELNSEMDTSFIIEKLLSISTGGQGELPSSSMGISVRKPCFNDDGSMKHSHIDMKNKSRSYIHTKTNGDES